MNVRASAATLAAIDARADAAGRLRSDEVRALIAYALANMPAGWEASV